MPKRIIKSAPPTACNTRLKTGAGICVIQLVQPPVSSRGCTRARNTLFLIQFDHMKKGSWGASLFMLLLERQPLRKPKDACLSGVRLIRRAQHRQAALNSPKVYCPPKSALAALNPNYLTFLILGARGVYPLAAKMSASGVANIVAPTHGCIRIASEVGAMAYGSRYTVGMGGWI